MAGSGRESNWVHCKFGQVLRLEYGKALKRADRNDAGSFNVYGSSGIVGKHDEALVEGPAVIIGRKGSVGSVFFSEHGFWPIDTTYYVTPPSYFDAKYLAYYLGFLGLHQLDTSTAVPGLNRNDAYAVDISVPPLNEQRRIVTKIEELFSELDNGVESLKAARAQLKTYRQSLLKAAFAGRLTEQWRRDNANETGTSNKVLESIRKQRDAHHQEKLDLWETDVENWESSGKPGNRPRKPRLHKVVESDHDDSQALVHGWLWRSLAEVSDHIVDGTHKTPTYVARGVPFVSAKDILNFSVDFSDTRFVSRDEHEKLIKRCKPSFGDVLITKSGTIGRVGVVESDQEFSVFESVAVVPVLRGMNSRFVAYAAYYFINNGFGAKIQKGVAVRHLHLEDLRRLPVPVPPIGEQEHMVRVIDSQISSICRLEGDIDEELSRSNHLRQSILKTAFEGKIVPQDPDDEPASVLLERIRAEQEKEPKSAKGRRKANA